MSVGNAEATAPAVSVVVPARNAAAVLPEQLDACAALRGAPPFEVIVVDNGSTDRTAEVALAYAGRFGSLRVVHEPRRGTGHARNAGARAAAAPVLLFVDADDRIDPDYLVHALPRLTGADAVGGQVVPFEDRRDGRRATTHAPRDMDEAALAARTGRRLGWLPVANHGGLLIRAGVFRALGGLDPVLTYGGDEAEFSYRLQAAGYRLAFEPAAVMWFRTDPGDTRTQLRKAFAYGRSDPYVYRRFAAAGMPRARPASALRMWWWLARTVPRLAVDESHRSHWAAHAGRRAGRLVGSVEHRVLFP